MDKGAGITKDTRLEIWVESQCDFEITFLDIES